MEAPIATTYVITVPSDASIEVRDLLRATLARVRSRGGSVEEGAHFVTRAELIDYLRDSCGMALKPARQQGGMLWLRLARYGIDAETSPHLVMACLWCELTPNACRCRGDERGDGKWHHDLVIDHWKISLRSLEEFAAAVDGITWRLLGPTRKQWLKEWVARLVLLAEN